MLTLVTLFEKKLAGGVVTYMLGMKMTPTEGVGAAF